MIILYDEPTGRIIQTFLVVAPSLEEYAATVLEPSGKKYLFWEGDNIEKMYAPNGVMTMRPVVTVTGDIRQVTADGDDTLSLEVDRPAVIKVIANRQIIATDTVMDGMLELSFEHPGTYTVIVGGDFPIYDTILAIEAI